MKNSKTSTQLSNFYMLTWNSIKLFVQKYRRAYYQAFSI